MEENKLPKELYHYTSLETFYNIVKGKELWFFDTLSNYDKNEYSLVEKKIKEVLKKEGYSTEGINIERTLGGPYYSLSLTSEDDSFFHFHKYANENFGVCIGFDTEALTSALNRLYKISEGDIIHIVPMYYQNDKQLEALITQQFKIDEEKLGLNKISDNNPLRTVVLNNVVSALLYKFAKIIKSSNYKTENEYRFFYSEADALISIILSCTDRLSKKTNKTMLEELALNKENVNKLLRFKEDFVCANGKIRRCCQINIAPIINQNIISKIIIGSKCKNSVDDIKAFLEYNNVHVAQVVSSQINID